MVQGPTTVATICFTALPGSSAFARLVVTNIARIRSDGAAVGSIVGQSGRVVLVGSQPLLEAWISTNSQRMLTLYANPGASYLMNFSTNLAATNWSLAWRVPLTNLFESFEANDALSQVFYRANEFVAEPPLLDLQGANTNFTLLLYAKPGTNYILETTTNLSASGIWVSAANFLLTNSFQFIGLTGPTNSSQFYRIKCP